MNAGSTNPRQEATVKQKIQSTSSMKRQAGDRRGQIIEPQLQTTREGTGKPHGSKRMPISIRRRSGRWGARSTMHGNSRKERKKEED